MNETELRERLAALYAEGAPLAARSREGALTEAEAARLDAIAAEVADLQPKYDAAKRRAASAGALEQGNAHFNQPAGARASGLVPNGGRRDENGARDDAEHWTIGDRLVRSENFREYRAVAGQGLSMRPLAVRSFYEPHLERLREDESFERREERALINTGVVAVAIQPQRLPGIVAPDARPLRTRDVMANAQTDSNAVEFVRQATVTNNAAEVAEATSLATGLKPESGFTLETDSAPVRTIAHIEYATRQALDDMAQLRSIIEDQLRRGVEEREDRQLLVGDGVAPNLRGIYNTANVQNLNGAYWAANPLPAAGAAANKWDRLLRAVNKVRITGRARASAIVMHPNQIEEFLLFKVNTGAYAFASGGPVGTGSVPTMWGLPIVEHEDIPENMAMVGAFNRFSIVYDRMASQVYVTDSNRDLFERNIITFLAESRLALVVTRPIAFAKVDLVASA